MTERFLVLARAALEEQDWTQARRHATAAVAAGFSAGHEIAAMAAWKQGDYGSAVAAFEAMDGQTPLSIAHLARLYLLTGNEGPAWRLVWDACRAGAFGESLYDLPRWDGGEIAGKHLAVWGTGCGDDMLFARFVPALAERGARVSVNCRQSLVRLFRSLHGVHQVLPVDQPAEGADLHVHLAELPGLLGITAEATWHGKPYLSAQAPTPCDGDGFDVGLVWAADSRHMEAQERSSLLARMRPLARVPGVRLHSLQMGTPRQQLYPAPQGLESIVDRAPEIGDFADTANLIAGLDLVVSIDTSVSNLAGAMGAPVWAALPYVPDWRWGRDGPRTHWYPSARVFRQAAPGDWDGVFQEMADALAENVAAGAAPADLSPAAPTPAGATHARAAG